MNVLGHTHVAERLRPADPEHALGAVLPDLAAMAGVRLRPPGIGDGALAPALSDGIRCHHATDAAFHGLPEFRAGAAALRRDLLAAGVRTGPARAVAHVGYELVLDGTLVGSTTERAYRAALAVAAMPGSTVLDAIAPAHRATWRAFVERVTASPAPVVGDDVEWVAERLAVIVARRPRLAFGPGDREVAAVVLGRHAAAVRAGAPAVLDSTFAAVVAG